MIALILAAAVMAGVFIRWAANLDRNDHVTYRHHLMHTERSGCIECKTLGWDD